MTRIGISDARDHLCDVVDKARYTADRIVLTKRGRDVGAIISIDDLKLLELLEDQLDVSAARKALEDSQGERIPYADIRNDLGL